MARCGLHDVEGRRVVLGGAAGDLRGERGQHGGPVGARVERAGQPGDRPERRFRPCQQGGRTARPSVVRPHRGLQPGTADPCAATAVAQQMAPAVRAAPTALRGQIRAQGDHSGARGHHGTGPLAQRTGVRGHGVRREGEVVHPERGGQRGRQPGTQLRAQRRHTGRAHAHRRKPVRTRFAPQLLRHGQELAQHMVRVDPGGTGAHRLGRGAAGQRPGLGVVGACDGDPQPRTARVDPEHPEETAGPEGTRAVAGGLSQSRGRPA